MTIACSNGRARHKWTRRHDLVGGLPENPGVFGMAGAAILIREACPHCGARRERIIGDVDKPARNCGWRIESDNRSTP